MLGYAFQKGLIPLGLDSIMQAIALNGVAVAKNQETFAWGRRAAAIRRLWRRRRGLFCVSLRRRLPILVRWSSIARSC